MRKLLLFISVLWVLGVSSAFAAEFVSPIGFEPTEANKAAVVAYIKHNVKQEYSRIGMDTESVLRMMEDENLKAFKQLLKAQDEEVLSRVIKTYCGVGMCNYTTILMMYDEEMKAKGKSLSW